MTPLAAATRPWTSAAGTGPTLRGRRSDDGIRPIIHFLHGNGFCGGVYWQFLSRLSPDFGLFLHDLEGHGESDAPESFSGVDALVERIPRVMAEQGLAGPGAPPVIGIGHSFGAALTLRVAAEHPQLFRAIVMLDPITMPVPFWLLWRGLGAVGLNPMANGTRKRRTRWDSRDAAAESLRGRGIFKGWTEPALRDFVDHALAEDPDGGARLRCDPELEATIYEHPVWPWGAFRRNTVDTLFLYGSGSYPFFPWAGRSAARLNPRHVNQALPGHHCFMMEGPDAAAVAVRGFLAERGIGP